MNQGVIWDQGLAITIQMSHLREVEVLNTQSKARALQMPNKLADKDGYIPGPGSYDPLSFIGKEGKHFSIRPPTA
jgi:hypothetical protein